MRAPSEQGAILNCTFAGSAQAARSALHLLSDAPGYFLKLPPRHAHVLDGRAIRAEHLGALYRLAVGPIQQLISGDDPVLWLLRCIGHQVGQRSDGVRAVCLSQLPQSAVSV
ncbi:MAG: hypothetical protein LBU72_08305 [Burkholderiaceae bacterium]|jgi:hypothetical protein|nr:hypothetical protein [Burkholderiaceae bacterium]